MKGMSLLERQYQNPDYEVEILNVSIHNMVCSVVVVSHFCLVTPCRAR